MSEFRRRLMMARKAKPYDAEVEYIATDGRAYIDTGIYVKQTTTFSLTFYIPNTYESGIWIFGTRNSSSAGQMAVQLDYPSGRTNWRFGNQNSYNSIFSSGTCTFSNMDIPRVLKYDNKSITANANNFSGSYSFLIFALNISGAASSCGDGIRFLGGQIYDNGTLVRDFITVRVGQVGYLYDRVTKQLFGNLRENQAFYIGNDKTI